MAVKKRIVDYIVNVKTDIKDGKGTWGELATEAKAAAVGVGAVVAGFGAAGFAAVRMANDVTGAVDRINTLATNSGLAASTLAGLESVAAASGKELRNLLPKDLPKRIAEAAAGSGDAVKGFEMLGVSVKDAAGNIKSSDVVLRETIDALGRVEDPTLKAAAAQQVFGARAQELTSALSDSGDLDAWVSFAEDYGTNVGPEAQRVTAKWQQSMAVFSAALSAAKNNALPLIDVLSNVVLGFAALTVGVTAALKSLTDWKNWVGWGWLFEGKSAIDEFANSFVGLNTELKTTKGRFDDATAAAKKLTGVFEAGDPATSALLIAFTGGNKGGKPPAGDPPKTGGGKRPARWDDTIKVQKLEAVAAEHGEELRKNREALQAGTKTQIDANQLLDRMGDGIAVFARAADRGVTAESVAGAGMAAQSALSPVALITGAVTDIANVIGSAASMVEGVTEAIVSLPDQLIALPEAVVGLIDGLAGLIPALVEASPQIALAIADAMMSTALVAVEIVGQSIGAMFGALPGKIAEAIAEVFKNLGGQLNPFDGDGNFLFGAAEKAKSAIPFFETGGDVSSTGLAVLHEGERVLTADERRALMGGGIGGSGKVVVNNPSPLAAARAVSRAIGPRGLRQRIVQGA